MGSGSAVDRSPFSMVAMIHAAPPNLAEDADLGRSRPPLASHVGERVRLRRRSLTRLGCRWGAGAIVGGRGGTIDTPAPCAEARASCQHPEMAAILAKFADAR
jgi:hypothetical protein